MPMVNGRTESHEHAHTHTIPRSTIYLHDSVQLFRCDTEHAACVCCRDPFGRPGIYFDVKTTDMNSFHRYLFP